MNKREREWIKINELIGKRTVCGQLAALRNYHQQANNELDTEFKNIVNKKWPSPFIDYLVRFVETLIGELTDDDTEIMKLYQRLNFNDTDDLRVINARNDAMLFIMWNIHDETSDAWRKYYDAKDGLNQFKD